MPGARRLSRFLHPAATLVLAVLVLCGCGSGRPPEPAEAPVPAAIGPGRVAPERPSGLPRLAGLAGLAGMPAVLDPGNVYAADGPGGLAPAVRADPARVYVPNSGDGTVDVIDQATMRKVGHRSDR